jgi:hypothetical protein
VENIFAVMRAAPRTSPFASVVADESGGKPSSLEGADALAAVGACNGYIVYCKIEKPQ